MFCWKKAGEKEDLLSLTEKKNSKNGIQTQIMNCEHVTNVSRIKMWMKFPPSPPPPTSGDSLMEQFPESETVSLLD